MRQEQLQHLHVPGRRVGHSGRADNRLGSRRRPGRAVPGGAGLHGRSAAGRAYAAGGVRGGALHRAHGAGFRLHSLRGRSGRRLRHLASFST